jgi:hypothetical protein
VLLRLLRRDPALVLVALTGAGIFGLLLNHLTGLRDRGIDPQLLTASPWLCEVEDPSGLPLIARSIETFHPDGASEGLARLEHRGTGRLLLEFSYQGFWQLDESRLVEAIRSYRYRHVDPELFTAQALDEIESEFSEPEVSTVHRMTAAELIYGVDEFVYTCHRPAQLG